MKKILGAFLIILAIGCSSKNIIGSKPDLIVQKSTVQEYVPGIENGSTKFRFEIELNKFDNKIELDSIVFNSVSSKLFHIKSSNKYTSELFISYEKLLKLRGNGFNSNQATVHYRVNDIPNTMELKEIEVLEVVYAP